MVRESSLKLVNVHLKHGLVLCTVLGLVSMLGCILLAKPLLYLMKQPAEVVELALPYLEFGSIFFGAFDYFSRVSNSFVTVSPMTRYPMYATVIS